MLEANLAQLTAITRTLNSWRRMLEVGTMPSLALTLPVPLEQARRAFREARGGRSLEASQAFECSSVSNPLGRHPSKRWAN